MSDQFNKGEKSSRQSPCNATQGSSDRCALIVTGEASGDLHGANLIRAARQIDPDLSFFGVGGRLMEEAGCEILISGEELAVMGLVEVVGHFPVIWRAFQRLKKILHGPHKPQVLILIDFPDFNLRLAKEAKRAGIPVLYYISPQVWAWRRGRVKKIARVVDRLAAVFPFEPEFYRNEDVEVEYVGHPLLDEFRIDLNREDYLRKVGIDPVHQVVGLFPGSRRNEIHYMLETILTAAERIYSKLPDTRFLIPVAPSLDREIILKRLKEFDLPVVLVEGNIHDAANACDAVISVSGTVTLQVAMVGVPMAILYKLSPLSYAIGKRLIKIPHIGLANIVAGKGVVREFIQDAATGEAVAAEIIAILENDDYARRIREGLSVVQQRMGEGGCSARVARMASELSRTSAGSRLG